MAATVHNERFMNSAALQSVLEAVTSWSDNNSMSLNATKTKSMNTHVNITSNTVNNADFQDVRFFKQMGDTIDGHSSFSNHVDNIFAKVRSKIQALLILKHHGASDESLIQFYLANIRSALSVVLVRQQ